MSLPDRTAAFLVHRPRTVWALAFLLVAASVAYLVTHARLNSDVLDMLPGHFESVQVYKLYNQEFAQGRELVFGLQDESGEADLEGFTEFFAAELRKQPWVVRVMAESPLTAPASLEELRAVSLPLLLNMPEAEFASLAARLRPEAITASLAQLHAEFAAGSPKAEFQLQNDPLGIILPPLQTLAETLSQKERPLKTEGLQVVSAITNQTDLRSPAYQLMAKNVEEFTARTLAAWEGPKPQVLFTGRTAYEGELSKKLEYDVSSTLASSLVLVAALFWIGYRRWKPLLAIMLALALCCVIAVALGTFIFHELNMITIGLCSILVGLGVDFAMLLYGIYMAEREAGHDHERSISLALHTHGRGILFGALTTAAAFLCMLRSGSAGFHQLGVLIACGILIAAGLMMTIFWVLLGKNVKPRGASRLTAAGVRYAEWAMTNARRLSLLTLGVLLLLTVYAAAPIGQIQFRADPKSLEPKNSNAGNALRLIQKKLDRSGVDPVLAVIKGRDAADFNARWEKAQAGWKPLVDSGQIRAIASPVSFALSPARVQRNAGLLASADLAAARQALDEAITREGFSPEAPAFQKAHTLLAALGEVAAGRLDALDWRKSLPESSAWWFIIDRFLSRDGLTGVAFMWTPQNLEGVAQTEPLRQALALPGLDVKVSGWSFTLAELGAWSQAKLGELTVLMLVLNVSLLIYLFRRVAPVLILMSGLALAVGALFATIKVTGIELNLFNALAFPLVLGVGVDYGIYIALALDGPDPKRELSALIKPVLLSGLTTTVGFGSLGWAQTPALKGLGLLCGIGVGWSLLVTFLFVLPMMVWRKSNDDSKAPVTS